MALKLVPKQQTNRIKLTPKPTAIESIRERNIQALGQIGSTFGQIGKTIGKAFEPEPTTRLGGEIEETTPILQRQPDPLPSPSEALERRQLQIKALEAPTPTFAGQPVLGSVRPDISTQLASGKSRFQVAQEQRFPSTLTGKDLLRREEEAKLEREAELQFPRVQDDLRRFQKEYEQKRKAGTITDEDRQKLRDLTSKFMEVQAQAKPFSTGLVQSLSLGTFQPSVKASTGGDVSTVLQQESAIGGQLIGEVTKQIAGYQVARNIVAGSQLANKFISAIGQKVGPKAAEFVTTQATDLLIDTVAQAPREAFEIIDQDKSLGQASKDFVANRALDVLFNLGIGTVAEAFKSIKGNKTVVNQLNSVGVTPEQVETALRQGDQTFINNLRQQLLESPVVKQTETPFIREIDDPFLKATRESVQATEEVTKSVNDFQQWRSQNFGGATGKVTPDDLETLKILYKEDTGSSIDDALQNALKQEEKLRLAKIAGLDNTEFKQIKDYVDSPISLQNAESISKVNPIKYFDGTEKTVPKTTVELKSQFINPTNEYRKAILDSTSTQAKKLPLSYTNTDAMRNLRSFFGDDTAEKLFIKPFDEAKLRHTQALTDKTEQLKFITDKLGIKKGSELSKKVQQFGEGRITLDELKLSTPEWQKVVQADTWFRDQYDTMLDEINLVRAQIFPNNPDKIIPKRDDYYRHFQEISNLDALKNIIQSPAQIDPKLAAISEFTTPKSKWQSMFQKRTGDLTDLDAVGGFLDYIRGYAYSTQIDPQIAVFRELTQDLANNTSGNANNFINWLGKWTNDLSGKTNPLDRAFQDSILGRKAFNVINWVNSRVKANTVLGKASSAVSQLANMPQGIATIIGNNPTNIRFLGQGMSDSMASVLGKGHADLYKQSSFLTERYGDKLFRQFDTKAFDKIQNGALWLMETSDEVATKAMWSSLYDKAVAQGIDNPIRFADNTTRNLVAGRGIGEVPLTQRSKLLQLFMPFTVEVNNLWKVQKDFFTKKEFGALVTLYLTSWLFNNTTEEITGNRVVFDPVDALGDAVNIAKDPEESNKLIKSSGRIVGETLGNTPLGSQLAQIYPEFGGNFFGFELPTRQEFFGEQDPTRFGTGLLLTKGLQNPLTKLALPFGGEQVKRTISGAETLLKGFSETKSGKVRTPVKINARNIFQALVFGQYSIPEVRDFFEKTKTPLSIKETEEFIDRSKREDPQLVYQDILQRKEKRKGDR